MVIWKKNSDFFDENIDIDVSDEKLWDVWKKELDKLLDDILLVSDKKEIISEEDFEELNKLKLEVEKNWTKKDLDNLKKYLDVIKIQKKQSDKFFYEERIKQNKKNIEQEIIQEILDSDKNKNPIAKIVWKLIKIIRNF